MRFSQSIRSLLFEWSRSDTSATSGSRNQIVWLLESCLFDAWVIGWNTVTAHAGIIAVEQRRVDRVICITSPVPVLGIQPVLANRVHWYSGKCTYRLVTSITTFVAERLLVCPDVVTVCRKQVRLANYPSVHCHQSSLGKVIHTVE